MHIRHHFCFELVLLCLSDLSLLHKFPPLSIPGFISSCLSGLVFFCHTCVRRSLCVCGCPCVPHDGPVSRLPGRLDSPFLRQQHSPSDCSPPPSRTPPHKRRQPGPPGRYWTDLAEGHCISVGSPSHQSSL